MPRAAPRVAIKDLFSTVVEEFDLSISSPNLLSYGQKSYPEQERFHKSDAFGRFISGGNRGGKTDAIVVESIWLATDTHPFRDRPAKWGHGAIQQRFVVVDVTKGVELIILPKLKRWIPKSYLIEGRWDKSWDSGSLILTFANGSTIDFVTHGMTLDKHGGVPRHVIYFDEEPPQPIYNENMMRLIDFDGYWVIAATPVKGMGWTYDLLWEPSVEGTLKDVDTFTLSAEQNPYLEAETFDRFMIGMNKEEREIRESGAFVARSGLVFPQFNMNLDKFVIEPMMPPLNWEIYTSVDHGYNNPTAWLWHAVSPQGDIVTFAEHYASEMIVADHSNIVKEREKAWGRVITYRVGDPAMKQRNGVTGTSIITEYALNGIYIGVEGIPHDVMIGIEKQQQYFQFREDSIWAPEGGVGPKWVITSNCHNYIRELKRLRWATYSSDRIAYDMNKQEEVHKKDDHAFDSGRYFATTRPELTPIGYSGLTRPDKPKTISYQEMMGKLAADPTVHFVDDELTEWTTQVSNEDLYDRSI